MANAVKWEAAWVDAGDVLGDTELAPSGTGLANAARSAAGTEYNNSTGLNQYGCLEVALASFTASAGGYLTIYMVSAPDGTNYADGSASVDPGNHAIVAVIPLNAATAAVRKVTGIFPLPPAKIKFLLTNSSGGGFANSGNAVALYVTNDEIQ